MSSEMVRWGGLAGLAAGAMFVLSGVLTFIVAPPPQGGLDSFGAYLLEVVIVAAFALTLVAIAGLHAAQSRSGRYGLLGAAGSLLTFVGYAIVLVIAHLIRLAGGEPILSVRPVGGVVGARQLDTPGSHDHIRAGAAVVVRRAAHLRLPPGRVLGERPCGDREHRVRGRLGVDRLRALVAEGHGSRATLTRELNF
jgi:hypothetical protein